MLLIISWVLYITSATIVLLVPIETIVDWEAKLRSCPIALVTLIAIGIMSSITMIMTYGFWRVMAIQVPISTVLSYKNYKQQKKELYYDYYIL